MKREAVPHYGITGLNIFFMFCTISSFSSRLPVVHGFDVSPHIINSRVAPAAAGSSFTLNAFSTSTSCIHSKSATSVLYMKPHEKHDDDNANNKHLYSGKERSILQSLRSKWRNRLFRIKDKAIKKKQRSIATVAAFLFAWASPRTITKVAPAPPVAHAADTTQYFPPAALVESRGAKDATTNDATTRNVLVLGAAGTGGAIGQSLTSNLRMKRKEKKNKKKIKSKRNGEEQFNQIMGEDTMKVNNDEKYKFALVKTEKKLVSALKGKNDAEARAKEAELALTEATEWAKSEVTLRETAEDLAKAGDEMYASLEALVGDLEKKARNEATARRAMEQKVVDSDKELRDAIEEIERLRELSTAINADKETNESMIQKERAARIQAEKEAAAAKEAKEIAQVISRKSEDALQKAEATIRTTANHYRTLKEKSQNYMDAAKSAEKKLYMAESKMGKLKKMADNERAARRMAEEQLYVLQQEMKFASSSVSKSAEENEEEDGILPQDKFAELKNELDHGWMNGGYINMDRTSKEFKWAVHKKRRDGSEKHQQSEDEDDKYGPQH